MYHRAFSRYLAILPIQRLWALRLGLKVRRHTAHAHRILLVLPGKAVRFKTYISTRIWYNLLRRHATGTRDGRIL